MNDVDTILSKIEKYCDEETHYMVDNEQVDKEKTVLFLETAGKSDEQIYYEYAPRADSLKYKVFILQRV